MTKAIQLSLIFLFSLVYAQEIDLYSLINKSYIFNKADYSVINNKKIVFIKPKNISFLNADYKNTNYKFKILQLKNESEFKNLLQSQTEDTFLFDIIFNSICNKALTVTLQIKSTNSKMYTEGLVPFFTFEDERKILLKYNKKYKRWEFYKILNISEEPHT